MGTGVSWDCLYRLRTTSGDRFSTLKKIFPEPPELRLVDLSEKWV
ncbi:MAG: hypothetical protein HEQ35_31430 [Gloeotrichia echinulata IR180]